MGLWARVLTAGAAVLVASPAFAHCHFSKTGDCYALAISFEEGWNYSAGVVAPLASPSTGALRPDTRATVKRAALRAEPPRAKESPARAHLKDLFADGGRMLDPEGNLWTKKDMAALFGKKPYKARYAIYGPSINATDLAEGSSFAVVEWEATIGGGMPHHVFAMLVKGAGGWMFDTVVMIRNDAPDTKKNGKAADPKDAPAKKGTSSN